jgi:hypothetical protein
MTKIVILTGKAGDLCNRLFRFARFYCAKPPGVCLIDLTLYQFVYLYAPKFPLWRLLFLLLRLLDNKRFSVAVRALEMIPGVCKIDPTSFGTETKNQDLSKFYSHVQRTPGRIFLVEASTYYMQVENSTNFPIDRLKKIFHLKSHYHSASKEFLKHRNPQATLIGVHLRRRDYRTFAGGRFYFDDEQYKNILIKLASTAPGNAPIQFVMVCEEPIETDVYKPLNVLCFGPSSIGVDQALLASADYLVGPPSTFSGWVSFLHGIPRAEIQSSEHNISWGDFHDTPCNYISI